MGESRLLTFLFTDLVDSTRLLDALGDRRFDEVRNTHFAALKTAIERHGGREVKSLGDGVMAVFDSPAGALESAVAMQRAAGRQAARLQDGALAIRVGVNTGEASTEDGDYFGASVVIASRLCNAAQSGQILAAAIVATLAAGRLDHEVRDLGSLDLKGVSQPVGVVELVWDALEQSRVPLPTRMARLRRPAFVGREAELERLRGALSEVKAGGARLVAISGEAGVGKTRLVCAFCAEGFAAGATVLEGRCHEDGLVPYRPFSEALRHLVSTCPLEDLEQLLGRHGAELVRLVPELHERLPDLPSAGSGELEGMRFRLFEAVRHLLTASALDRPVVLVVDDVHWADEPTLLLLVYLLRAPEQARLLVLATFREHEGVDRRLGAALSEVHREGMLDRIPLHGLDDDAIGAIVSESAGPDPPLAFVQRLREETEGNPFFAQEMLRHLAETGAMVREDDRWRAPQNPGGLGVPDQVREVLAQRLLKLGAEAVTVLEAAAVLGRTFRLNSLQALDLLASRDVSGALEHALQAGLLEERAQGLGHYRFPHALVREALYQGLPPIRRARLHLQAGEALERVGDPLESERLAELAHHFVQSAHIGDPERAVTYAVRAGAWLEGQVAFEEAAALYERALDALELVAGSSLDRRCELLLTIGEARWRANGRDGARDAFVRAFELAERLSLSERVARAALGLAGPFSQVGAPDAQIMGMLEKALAGLPEDAGALRARTMARLADGLTFTPQVDRRERLAREALDVARRAGDPAALGDVLGAATWALWSPDNLEERVALSDEMARVQAAAGDTGLAKYASAWRLATVLELGDRAAADAVIDEERAEADRLRRPHQLWQAGTHRAAVALLEGRLDEVEPLASNALALAPEQNNAVQIYGIQMLFLRREQGRLAEMVDAVRTYSEQAPEFPAWRGALAWVCVETGRHEEAREIAAGMLPDRVGCLPRDVLWLSGMVVLTDACVEVCDTQAAEVLYELLSPYAGRALVVAPVAAVHGTVARPVGRLAGLLGRYEQAERHFARALEIATALRSPPSIGHTLVDHAEVLLRAGEPKAAQKLCDRAMAQAAARGLTRVAQRAARLGAGSAAQTE